MSSRPRTPFPIQITVGRYAVVTDLRSTPWKSGTLLADLKLKNTGREGISILDCWASQLDGRNIPGGFRGTAYLTPGDSCSPHIFLPGDTSRWMIISKVSRFWTPSEYAVARLQRLKWLPKIFRPLAWRVLVAFPRKPRPFYLESDPIEIGDGTNGLPRTYRLHSVPATY